MSPRKTRARRKDESRADYASQRAVKWVGSLPSLIFHTVAFIVSFSLYFFGVALETILLVVTTIVSLEAIYLSIFVQMTLNRHSTELEDIQEDVEDIQEDVGDIQEDVGGIQEDVDEIAKDVDEIQEDVDEIAKDVEDIQEDVEEIQEDEESAPATVSIDPAMLSRIELSLRQLGEEIAEMKRRGK